MKLLVLFSVVAVAFAKPALVARDPMINENLFEGDILGIDPDSDRNAVADERLLWPSGVVPYEITPEVANLKEIIEQAMRHIESKSCIRFVKRGSEDRNYVRMFKGTGCYSYWGRIGGAQQLSLGEGCDNFAVVLHELMHAIGFEHEHNRSDRDDYLIIKWENINQDFYYAFQKLQPNQNRLLTQFDFSSIMLYGSRSFAKDYYSNNYSMVRKDGKFIPEIYDRKAMSVLDAQRINMLYRC